jgi:hypothetical protein
MKVAHYYIEKGKLTIAKSKSSPLAYSLVVRLLLDLILSKTSLP